MRRRGLSSAQLGTVSTAPKRGQISKTSIGGSRPVTIRECHTTTATSSAGNIASEQVTILLESSSGRRVKQIASKPKSLAVTVPRDSGDEERNRREVKHRGTMERKGENILGLGGMSPAREKL
ncbi:hypothetical protein ACOSQ2_003222 [Xanthoceras sorbifolium]